MSEDHRSRGGDCANVRLQGLLNKARSSNRRIECLGPSFMVLSYRLEPGFYEKSDRLVKSIRDKPEWPIRVRETPSTFRGLLRCGTALLRVHRGFGDGEQ